jgi:MFS family permease
MTVLDRFRPQDIRRWIARWHTILPLLVAEFVVLVGFGALLPVLPLYVVGQGIDLPTLGLITAGWSMAKLIAEPIFGVLADRGGRKPLMLSGLVLMSVLMVLPIFFRDAFALFALRFLAGVTAGMYDPAARGIIVDATDEGERGEAFGLYSAAAMGGLIFGPIIGSLGAAFGGGYTFPFVFTGALLLVAAAYLARVLPAVVVPRPSNGREPAEPSAIERPSAVGHRPTHIYSDRPGAQELEPAWVTTSTGDRQHQAPLRQLLNRPLAAAVAMNLGLYCAVGVYDVIWSLFMQRLGASLEWIGFTFTLFGLPVLLVSPFAGRIIDRGNPVRYAAIGGLVVAACGFVYSLAIEPVAPALVGIVEACAIGFMGPALYALLARGTPQGRSSTAQGVFGASGTVGTIGASLLSGVLWATDPHYPLYFLVVATAVGVMVGVLVAPRDGGRLAAVGRSVPAVG